MEYYDPEKTARVWQRVQGRGCPEPMPTPTPEFPTLEELIAAELEAAATYERMARRYTNPERMRFLRMAREERAHAAFLRSLLPHSIRR